MKKSVLHTTIQILFLFVFTIVVIMISLGITQDFTKLTTSSFWVEVSFQLAETMVVYNIVYGMDMTNRIHDETSRFFLAYMTFRLRKKDITSNRRYEELRKAVEKKNQENLEERCNSLLYKFCTGISYKEVIGEKPIEKIIEEYLIPQKKSKKFTKLINKIRAGQVKFEKVNCAMFLKDKEIFLNDKKKYDYNNFLMWFMRNFKKVGTFLIVTIVGAVTSFSFASPNILKAILTNISLILGAIVSAFISSQEDIKVKTAIYENRNDFYDEYLNVNVEYGS